jgi:adenylate kinase family enzyme
MKKHLIIIRGTPGSGKSTMAAKLIDNDNATGNAFGAFMRHGL